VEVIDIATIDDAFYKIVANDVRFRYVINNATLSPTS
jgi:hypothetical protein